MCNEGDVGVFGKYCTATRTVQYACEHNKNKSSSVLSENMTYSSCSKNWMTLIESFK